MCRRVLLSRDRVRPDRAHRAGSFRKEMAPFAVRWVYGRAVPHISAAFIYHG